VYSAIGWQIARQDHDVSAGRAVVGRREKLFAGLAAAVQQAPRWIESLGQPIPPATLEAASHGPELLRL
jgi:hypothetical protein